MTSHAALLDLASRFLPGLLQPCLLTGIGDLQFGFYPQTETRISAVANQSLRPLTHLRVLNQVTGYDFTFAELDEKSLEMHQVAEYLRSDVVLNPLSAKYLPGGDLGGIGAKIVYRAINFDPRRVEIGIAMGKPELVNALTDDMFFS